MSKHQRGACVRVKTRYFEKFKIIFCTQINTRRILFTLTLIYSEEFRRYSSIFLDMNYGMFGQAVSKYMIVLVCVMF